MSVIEAGLKNSNGGVQPEFVFESKFVHVLSTVILIRNFDLPGDSFCSSVFIDALASSVSSHPANTKTRQTERRHTPNEQKDFHKLILSSRPQERGIISTHVDYPFSTLATEAIHNLVTIETSTLREKLSTRTGKMDTPLVRSFSA